MSKRQRWQLLGMTTLCLFLDAKVSHELRGHMGAGEPPTSALQLAHGVHTAVQERATGDHGKAWDIAECARTLRILHCWGKMAWEEAGAGFTHTSVGASAYLHSRCHLDSRSGPHPPDSGYPVTASLLPKPQLS